MIFLAWALRNSWDLTPLRKLIPKIKGFDDLLTFYSQMKAILLKGNEKM